MTDPTEAIRRAMLDSGMPLTDLAADTGQRWDTQQLGADFVVHSFLAPFVHVTRKADGVQGTLEFTHSPRVYFGFTPA